MSVRAYTRFHAHFEACARCTNRPYDLCAIGQSLRDAMARDAGDVPACQEMCTISTDLGPALYVRVSTPAYRQLSWSEVAAVLHDRYPEQWGVQSFPFPASTVDEVNIYHVLLFDHAPRGFDLFDRELRAFARQQNPF